MLSGNELEQLQRLVDGGALKRLYDVEKLRWEKFELLSSGFVCLVDVMGDDSSVVQAARVSYGKGTKKTSDDQTLIKYLMRHRHTTPFEMAEIKLLVKCPMDLWRQWIRHRTANVNEYSTRYSVAIDDCDETPEGAWRLQSDKNKQGSGEFLEEWPEGYKVIPCDETGDPYMAEWTPDELREHENFVVWRNPPDSEEEIEEDDPAFGVQWFFDGVSYDSITPGLFLSMLEREIHEFSRREYLRRVEQFNIAREQARKDLPLSTYTMAYWKIDLHNLLHFLSLRMHSHAQKEIRDFATVIGEKIVAPLFPAVWQAFVQYRLEGTFLSLAAREIMQAMIQNADETIGRPPYGHKYFEQIVGECYPPWVDRKDGELKRHREREEVRATLVRLGVVEELS